MSTDFKVERAGDVIVRLIVHIVSLYLGLCGKASDRWQLYVLVRFACSLFVCLLCAL